MIPTIYSLAKAIPILNAASPQALLRSWRRRRSSSTTPAKTIGICCRSGRWPARMGCAATSKPLYLAANSGLSFTPPAGGSGGGNGATGYDAGRFRSGKARAVLAAARALRRRRAVALFGPGTVIRRWVADRPDVLVYPTPVLTEPLRVSGAPLVNLVGSDERDRQRLGGEIDQRLSR